MTSLHEASIWQAMMNIKAYLTRQSQNIICKFSGIYPLPAPSFAPCDVKRAAVCFAKSISKVAQIAKRIFDILVNLWIRPNKATTRLENLPSDIKGLIYQKLDKGDRPHFCNASRSMKASAASVKGQNCDELIKLLKSCFSKEPKLAKVFPNLEKYLLSNAGAPKSDLFILSQTDLNLRQALRMIALYWGYYHPDVLEKIIRHLGYHSADHLDCEGQFERLDTGWLYGPFIPQLLNRAVISSCVPSLKLILSFIPHCKRRGEDGNLSSSLAAGTALTKGGRADLNLAIICSLQRDLESRAEKRRFAAHYGREAADCLAEISPAFDDAQSLHLQSEKIDEEIWKLMRCVNKRDEIEKTAGNLHAIMERDLELCFPTHLFHRSAFGQLDEHSISLIPPVLWDRHLLYQKGRESISSNGQAEYQSQVQRIQLSFERATQQLVENDQTSQTSIYIINREFAAFIEMIRYRTSDSTLGANYYRKCPTLFQALQFSLFGYTHHAIALKEAVKCFLYQTKDPAFPHSKLDVLFNIFQESEEPKPRPTPQQIVTALIARFFDKSYSPSSLNETEHSSRDFLTYQWLFVAVVAKLFDRHFNICSKIRYDDAVRTCEEIEHFVHCAVEELRKYNLWDLAIEYQISPPKDGDERFISIGFSPQTARAKIPHSLIAKEDESDEEHFYVLARSDGPKGRFSPPQSP